jgi:hypothetical protein
MKTPLPPSSFLPHLGARKKAEGGGTNRAFLGLRFSGSSFILLE